MDVENLNSVMIDVLKEIGNIGSGNAVTSLANMLSKRVDMRVPKVRIMEFKDVAEVLGGEEELVAGIYLNLGSDVEGNIMFILDLDSALNLTNMLLGREDVELDDIAMSALSEVGNILASSYVNSLSGLTGLKITVSVPSLAIDMAGAILSVPAIQFGLIADQVLFIETVFQEGNNFVQGNLFLLPDMSSFEKILSSLGVL
ncbi:CheC, inhibitor of MCP methylation [[Clostridium] ultunense Esp]|uniref:CheC, inhibitor of MCP methylation n=1 Tax=[Clostridium] ultunense Esp TaxID=1288971 RepID=M1Z4S4_9FIRM|nr:chemotaxis protein CheC [Schnuerera ultunensis]CCQ93036.1 CheC, inhibitor of MCP methylation [[Clostridium] ultunense Esp]SHD77039.1 CheC, inhibitor of MCP methylation [[Clostridium] ultunense Esp]